MTDIELKPCPFCGDNQQLNYVELSNGLHYIECARCGAAPHRLGARNRETAVKYWNSVSRTEQSQEQKRGRWKLGSKTDNACVIPSDFGFYCTCCGKEAIRDYDDTQVLSDFCPNCGADMREEVTDNG